MSEAKIEAEHALRKLLETGAYSDLVVKCGDYEAAVHKAIICPRSEWFAAACKPGAFKEGQESVIYLKASTETEDDDVSTDDPQAVELMINFLYTHDYEAPAVIIRPDTASEAPAKPPTFTTKKRMLKMTTPVKPLDDPVPSGDCNTIMHAKMYAMGSKYAIDSLKSAALGKFAEAVTYAWDLEDFVEALNLAYTTTPDGDKALREVATQAVLQHQEVLLAKPEMETCIRSISGLAYDLLKMKTPEEGPSACKTCGTACMRQCSTCYQAVVSCDCQGTGRSAYTWFCKTCHPR